jgi:VWFA-related protein
LLDTLKPDDRASLVTFSRAVTQRSGLTADHAKVRAALDRADGAGETALIDGIYSSVLLGGAEGRGLVIVFSDGVDTASWLTRDALIDTVRRADAVIYTVSVQRGNGSDLLREVSEATGGSHFAVESTRHLDAVFLQILNEYRHRYLMSYSPTGVDEGGWHRLDVRVRGGRATIKARPGYYKER